MKARRLAGLLGGAIAVRYVVASLVGCHSSPVALTPAELVARVTCEDHALQAAQARVDRECAASPTFDACPAAASILTSLQTDQEACP